MINSLNAHDVLQTIELGIALKAEAVMFNRINLTRSTLPVAAQLVPSVHQLAQALDAAEEAARRYGVSVAVSVPIPPCVIDVSRYKNLHFGWCPRGGAGAYHTISYNGLFARAIILQSSLAICEQKASPRSSCAKRPAPSGTPSHPNAKTARSVARLLPGRLPLPPATNVLAQPLEWTRLSLSVYRPDPQGDFTFK